MSDYGMALYEKGVKLAQEAVLLDKAKKYGEAIVKYMDAASALMEFLKFNRNPVLVKTCKERIKNYIRRIETLKRMKKKVKVSNTGTSAPSKKTGDSEIDNIIDSDESMSEDEKEIMRSIMSTILVEKAEITWDDIAGLEEPKQAIREAVVLPIIHPELFKGARKPWSGILLYGPPGTGKTLLAKAAANEVNCTFMVADAASLTSKWQGESEKLAKMLFKVARMKAPTIIFFDEIDSIATKRGMGNESAGIRRLKTQLLQEMQGVRPSGEKLVVIIAATNRPWDIDSAFLRRLERRIYVPLPDFESRKAIIKFHTRDVEMEGIDFDTLAELTEGYSGADLAILCREAIMRPIRDLDKQGILNKKKGPIKVRPVVMEDFFEALKKIKRSVSDEELKQFEKWKLEFGG